MEQGSIRLDGEEIPAPAGSTILEAARAAEIYLPALCAHPDLPPARGLKGEGVVYRGAERVESDDSEGTFDGCGLCVVEVEGELVRACATEVREGLVAVTDCEPVRTERRRRLGEILVDHPHACLTCAQAEGCPRTQCSSNVPEGERCCELLGSCELGKVAAFVGIPEDLARYRPRGLPSLTDEPLYDWHPELCVACLRCVRACVELREVGTLSFAMQGGRPVVGTTTGPTRAESHCRFCGACVEVCPTGALLDKARATGDDRARLLVPCRDACPAGVDVPRLVRHVAQGEPDRAFAVLRERVPLARSVSHVCFHPCEESCRRGELNEPVSVCRLHRYAAGAANGAERSAPPRPPSTGRRVSVVGSGPAGLTAAYYLARKGHEVAVHEALGAAGGMLRVGIPEYRLPPGLLERDLEEIAAAGVEIHTSSPVDASRLKDLAEQSDAVFLAAGAPLARRLDLPGVELDGVDWGLEFLRRHALGELAGDALSGQRVLVIGGGNVAVDTARVARRLGARDVCAVSLEAREELPAWTWEVEEAEQEEVAFLCGWGPREIRGSEGRVTGVTLKRCTRVFDGEGRLRPKYDEADTRELDADCVLLSIGQQAPADLVAAAGGGPSGTIAVDGDTLETQLPNVYAGGDIASGPASVIEAIAMGRRAASRIDCLLGGDGDLEEIFTEPLVADPSLGRLEGFAALPRRVPQSARGGERAQSFCAVEAALVTEAAQAEAARCLCCDLRLDLEPSPLPPRAEALIPLTEAAVAEVPEVEGVFQLYAEDQGVLAIRGVMDLRAELQRTLQENETARFFTFEQDPMFTQRESELIQQYLQEHGELPGGGQDDLDDLF